MRSNVKSYTTIRPPAMTRGQPKSVLLRRTPEMVGVDGGSEAARSVAAGGCEILGSRDDGPNMNRTIERHRADIAALCREYGVKRLEVFGSAASDRFDPSRSDFDFVVEFDDADTDPRIHMRYIDFSDAMESLLGRPIDLLTDRALKPRFRAYIQNQRQLVYESTDRERAA